MSVNDATDAPWTTARCKRLLRPISSRLTLLRKKKTGNPHCNDQYATFTRKLKPQLEIGTASITKSSWSDASPNLDRKDPEWQPDVEESPRKKLKRTYSSKSSQISSRRQQIRAATIQSSVQLPSPLVGCRLSPASAVANSNGLRDSNVEVQIESNVTNTTGFRKRGYPWVAKANLRDAFRRLVKTLAPSDWMTYDGIYSALYTILQSTAKRKSSGDQGVQSLFSICLRTLPAHIASEQALAEEEDPDDPEDVASFMYNELEGFSSSRSPMRDVVRAHGVLLLCQAIEEGLILPAIARKLAMACLEADAPNEAEALVKSMLKVIRSIPKPQTNLDRLFSQSSSPAFQAMKDLSHHTGRYRFLFAQLSRLFENDIIDVAWASSQDMVEVWNRALRAITQNQDASLEAMELVQSVVRRTHVSGVGKACREIEGRNSLRSGANEKSKEIPDGGIDSLRNHDEKLSSALLATISNLLTVVLATIHAAYLSSEPSCASRIDAGLSLQLLRRLESDSRSFLAVLPDEVLEIVELPAKIAMVCIPALAMHILTPLDAREWSIDSTKWWFPRPEQASLRKNTVDILASLLCSIAQCCSRITMSPPFDILKHLVENLKQKSTDNKHQSLFNQIAVSTAFEFAEGTMRQEHLDWALRVEEAFTGIIEDLSPGRTPSTSRRQGKTSSNTVSFRWEDSICEWIACTPAPTKARAKKARVRQVPKARLGDMTQESERTEPASSEDDDEDTEPTSIENSQESSPLQAPRPLSKHKPMVIIPKTSRISGTTDNQNLVSDISPAVVIPKRSSQTLHNGKYSANFIYTTHLRFRPRPRRKHIDSGLEGCSSDSMSAAEEKYERKSKCRDTHESTRKSNLEVRIPAWNPRDPSVHHLPTKDGKRQLEVSRDAGGNLHPKSIRFDATDESADELGM